MYTGGSDHGSVFLKGIQDPEFVFVIFVAISACINQNCLFDWNYIFTRWTLDYDPDLDLNSNPEFWGGFLHYPHISVHSRALLKHAIEI